MELIMVIHVNINELKTVTHRLKLYSKVNAIQHLHLHHRNETAQISVRYRLMISQFVQKMVDSLVTSVSGDVFYNNDRRTMKEGPIVLDRDPQRLCQ